MGMGISGSENMKIDNEPPTEEDLVIRWQLIASFSSLILFALGIVISALLNGDLKYAILGITIPTIYVGISSIKNRVSIITFRGERRFMYSRGTRAIVMGAIVILWSLFMSSSIFLKD